MHLFKDGNLEVEVSNRSPHNISFDLRIGDELTETITLSQSQTTTDVIPIREIEGIVEKKKIKLQEIVLDFGIAKLKFGKNSK